MSEAMPAFEAGRLASEAAEVAKVVCATLHRGTLTVVAGSLTIRCGVSVANPPLLSKRS